MKRKILITLAVIVLLIIAAFIYIQNVFLPVQIKEIVSQQANEFFSRDVRYDTITFTPIKGFTIHNLTVYQKENPQEQFIHIDQVMFRILLPQIIKNQKLIISSVIVINPSIHMIRKSHDRWNFSDLMDKAQGEKQAQPSLPFLLGNFKINNGSIILTDRAFEPEFKETFDQINLNVNFSLKGAIKYLLEATIPQHASKINIDGEYRFLSKETSAHLDMQNIQVNQYLPRFYPNSEIRLHDGWIRFANLNFSGKDRDIQIHGDVQLPDLNIERPEKFILSGDLSSPNLSMSFQDQKIKIQSDFQIDQATLTHASEKTLQGNLHAKNTTIIIHNGDMDVQAALQLDQARYRFGEQNEISGNLMAKDIDFVYENQEFDLATTLQIDQAVLLIGPDQSIQGNISASEAHVSSKDNKINFHSHFQIKNADVHLGHERTLTGQPSIELDYEYDPKALFKYKFSGQLKLKDATLTGLPKIDTASHLKGHLEFETNKVQTESLEFEALDSTINLSGQLSNYQNPSVDIEFFTESFDLNHLDLFFMNTFKESPFLPIGQTALQGSYKGLIDEPDPDKFKLMAQLKNASLESVNDEKDITNILGDVTYQRNVITWKNLSGDYLGRKYTLNGRANISDLPVLLFETTADSDDLHLSTKCEINDKNYQFAYLKGDYKGSTFDMKGQVQLLDGQDQSLDISGKGKLNLNLLHEIPKPSFQETLKKIKPKGNLNVQAALKGLRQDWKNWQLQVSADSPNLSLYDYQFDKTSLKIGQNEGRIHQLDILSSAYKGHIDIKSTAELTDDLYPFNITANINGIELGQLKKDLPIDDKLLSGKITSSLSLNSRLKDFKETHGYGHLTISDGHLWRFNLFEGLWQVLFIPEYQDIVFTDAHTEFEIADQKIFTDRLEITGTTADLIGQGWLDFAGNINFLITPTFKDEAILKSKSLKKGPSAILAQTENYISIRMSGTLKTPSYTVNADPGRVIEKATDILKGGLQDVLGDIFD